MLLLKPGQSVLVHRHPLLANGGPGRTFRGRVEVVTSHYVTVAFKIDEVPARIDFSPHTGMSFRESHIFITMEP